MRRLFISFSGGETSGYMTRLLLTKWRDRYDEIVTVFANTGEENEETLEFVEHCDRAFKIGVVWVEAVVQHGKREGTGHRVVNISTASRNGEPYEDVIRKYGIPNAKFPHCTRELKQRPMESYIRSLGWEKGTYDTALGIRADEPQRRAKDAEKKRIIYPLMDWLPTTKPDVNRSWMEQAFRLNLAGYQGNCRWCWKKSARKLLTIMDDDPRTFDFPERMERTYGHVGPEFEKETRDGYRRVFFRGNTSAADLRRIYAENRETLERAEDDAIILPSGLPFALDIEDGSGCAEHCEVDFSA